MFAAQGVFQNESPSRNRPGDTRRRRHTHHRARNTLTTGLDPKTGKAPDKIEEEIKILLDGEKDVLAQAGMTMDDLVYVQISCTDLTLFEKFNPIYKSYFTKEYPARAFIGAGSLLRGGHFELQAIAVKR